MMEILLAFVRFVQLTSHGVKIKENNERIGVSQESIANQSFILLITVHSLNLNYQVPLEKVTPWQFTT